MMRSRILSVLVVLSMMLSMMIVFNETHIIEQASAISPGRIPGVNDWGNATTELTVGVTYNTEDVKIDTAGWTPGTYYLLPPFYNCTNPGSVAHSFQWGYGYYIDGGNLICVDADGGEDRLKPYDLDFTFDRAGMWIFDNSWTTHYGNDPSTYAGYIWVNTSKDFAIDPVDDVHFGDRTQVTLGVTKISDGLYQDSIIDLIAPDGTYVFHHWYIGGQKTFWANSTLTMAGEYTIRAYTDTDQYLTRYYYGDEGGDGYTTAYGSGPSFPTTPSTRADYYNYTHMGPWDPPEQNATDVTFTVQTGRPTMIMTNTTLYWGFKTRIDVNVTSPDGSGIDVSTAAIKLKKSSNNHYYSSTDFDAVTITNRQNGNYSIEIPHYNRNDAGIIHDWSILSNGTWYVYFAYDANSDGIQEWNSSIGTQNKLIIRGTEPPVQLIINNDGSGNAIDKKVDVPVYTPGSGTTPIITINFSIYGRSVTDEGGRAYYGDDYWEDWKNITVTGDILYPVSDHTLIHVGSIGDWSLMVTPTKPGGEINITINWPGEDNGLAYQVLDIINGSTVVPTIDSFSFGEATDLMFSVHDIDGDLVKTANVYLIWEEDNNEFNDTAGNTHAGNGQNGEYSRLIYPGDDYYPTSAPKNVTIAVKDPAYNNWGYAKVGMDVGPIIELRDCVNVSYIERYASNNTVIDSSYADWEHKTGDTPLNIYVNLTHSLAPKGYEQYSSDYIIGLLEGLIGLHEGQNAVIDVSPDEGFGEKRLDIGDIFNTTSLTFSTTNQTNYLVKVTDLNAQNITLYWWNPQNHSNLTMPEGILMEDLEHAVYSIYDPLPPYYIWQNHSQITTLTDEFARITTTPISTHHITDAILFVTVGSKMTFVFPDVTTASWNSSQIIVNSTPIKGTNYKFDYQNVEFNLTIGNVTSTHYNITIEMGGQFQNLIMNTTLEFPRNYTMRRIFIIPLMFIQYTIESDLEREGYSLSRLAGEELLFEVTIDKVYKTSMLNPNVVSTIPTNGATGVSISTNIIIEFNKSMNQTSVEHNLTISPSIGSYSCIWNSTNETLTINPTHDLQYDNTYTVRIDKNATEENGYPFVSDYSWSFRTQSSGNPSGPSPGSGNENKPPVADLSAGEPYTGYVDIAIRFDGSRSSDSDGNITKWEWLFGDSTTGSGVIVNHAYSEPGSYTVKLTVTDNDGDSGTDTTTVVIRVQNKSPSPPTIDGPTSGHVNVSYTYTVRSTDGNNDSIQYIFNWGDGTSDTSAFLPNGTVSTKNHSWKTAGKYTLKVTASDNQTSASSEKIILIDAILIGDIGYLTDDNGDGTYDTFHNSTSGENTSVQLNNGKYQIDSNGDGTWDYTYDSATGLTQIQTEQKKGTPGFEAILLIISLAFVFIWRKKRITGHE